MLDVVDIILVWTQHFGHCSVSKYPEEEEEKKTLAMSARVDWSKAETSLAGNKLGDAHF